MLPKSVQESKWQEATVSFVTYDCQLVNFCHHLLAGRDHLRFEFQEEGMVWLLTIMDAGYYEGEEHILLWHSFILHKIYHL